MQILLAVAASCLASPPLGPLDGLRANFAQTKADVRYHFERGTAPLESLERLRNWVRGEIGFVPNQPDSLDVRWACDGVREVLRCVTPEGAIPNAANAPVKGEKPSSSGPFVQVQRIAFETLCDGELYASHQLDQDYVYVGLHDPVKAFYRGAGPFVWWGSFHCPSSLKLRYGDAQPSIHGTSVGGVAALVSVFQKERTAGDWLRTEIYHDPSIGYLPRYVRNVYLNRGQAVCQEIFLLDARPCSEGGFVPTDLFETRFMSETPKHIGADEVDAGPGPRPTNKIVMGRLQATAFKDLRGQVALENLDNVRYVNSQGGHSPVVSKTPLTMSRIRTLLGRKMTDPPPPAFANLDRDELLRFSQPPATSWRWLWLTLGGSVLVGTFLFFWRRKRATLGLSLLLFVGSGLAGCGREQGPEVKISAAFERPHVLQRPRTDAASVNLIARNHGRSPIKMINVDAGCSCRKIRKRTKPHI
jgi:hypothetical protein